MTPTADLCDEHADEIQVIELPWRSYGAVPAFSGTVHTVKCHEDNTLVREALTEPGNGRVLVVDGGGSFRCALVGDRLATKAVDNGWSGVLVYGCIRDSKPIGEIAVGVMALGTCPRKSIKRGHGVRGETLRFGNAVIAEGSWVAADEDGVIVATESLRLG
ncbi:MAG: ribonuclease E activity regulator RraA [Bradymonadia bacterium]